VISLPDPGGVLASFSSTSHFSDDDRPHPGPTLRWQCGGLVVQPATGPTSTQTVAGSMGARSERRVELEIILYFSRLLNPAVS